MTAPIKEHSALSIYSFRVKGFQFMSCIIEGELPIDSSLSVVAGDRPCIGFLAKPLDARNAAA